MIIDLLLYVHERKFDMTLMDKNQKKSPYRSQNKETFIVKVDHCENETWQGRVTWAEENKSEHFRSALELIKLIDDALRSRLATKQDEDKENKNPA
jgi:hypothetical protein